jgi:hypothetical protein
MSSSACFCCRGVRLARVTPLLGAPAQARTAWAWKARAMESKKRALHVEGFCSAGETAIASPCMTTSWVPTALVRRSPTRLGRARGRGALGWPRAGRTARTRTAGVGSRGEVKQECINGRRAKRAVLAVDPDVPGLHRLHGDLEGDGFVGQHRQGDPLKVPVSLEPGDGYWRSTSRWAMRLARGLVGI